MSNWRARLAQWMQGRYGGNDTLNKWLLGAFLILLLLSLLLQSNLLNLLAILVLVYSYFRIFSRNITKRAAENQKFLELTQPIRRFFGGKKAAGQYSKTHRVYACPSCGQKVRVPKGRGKIEITCPKCRTSFIKRS